MHGGVGGGLRNIPAHAGKTNTVIRNGSYLPEHPRARGENVYAHLDEDGTPWNIPAHAGKTSTASGANSPPLEHPRARGENVLAL